MAFQRYQGISYHFLAQLRLHFYFYEPALGIGVSGFVFFRLLLQVVHPFYFFAHQVVAVDHDHQQEENEQKILVVHLYLVPVQEISFQDVHEGEALLLVCYFPFSQFGCWLVVGY